MRAFPRVNLLLLVTLTLFSFQDQSAYILFTKKGKEISYNKFLKELKEADVILFGELHDNTTAHQLELSLLKDLHQSKKENLVIGAEMFEADDQLKIDELINGTINPLSFAREAKLWDNFSDYKPLLDYAAENDLDFVATNVPRRYANLVGRKGLKALDSLSDEAKKYIAPLPVEVDFTLPGYAALQSDFMHSHGGLIYMAQAQAIKDATMAHFILQHYKKGKTFLHINGAYHSDNYEGIFWMLKKKNPDLKIVTISTVALKDIQKPSEQMLKKADFLLVTEEREGVE